MRKLSNGEKILVGLVIIMAIVALTSVIWSRTRQVDIIDDEQNESNAIENTFSSYTNEKNNIIENEITNELNETTVEEVVEPVQQTTSNSQENIGTNVTGQEEEESAAQNTELANQEKAIELAKEKWSISVDAYDFEPELQSDGTYKVTVINRTTRNVITIYTVNVSEGSVTE